MGRKILKVGVFEANPKRPVLWPMKRFDMKNNSYFDKNPAEKYYFGQW